MKIVMCVVVIGVVLGVMGGCGFPYEPTQEAAIGTKVDPNARLRPVNSPYQVCNSSITQNQAEYPGCMLWLNFGGVLNVHVPDKWKNEYDTVGVIQHDRLTVSDTGNNLRWFVKRPSFLLQGNNYSMQDPEWSSHPDYIALLGTEVVGNWSGFVIRMSNKEWFKWNNKKLLEASDPFLWLPESIQSVAASPTTVAYNADSLAGKADVNAFFNTTNVKIVFLKGNATGQLRPYYIDYTDSIPAMIELQVPPGKESWHCENPQISPDGKWVTYHYRINADDFEVYIQQLNSNADPIMVEKGAWPHWWKDPLTGALWIVYSSKGGVFSNLYVDKPTDPGYNADGSLGYTYFQKADLFIAADGSVPPKWLIFKETPRTLSKLPFKGGVSPDGRFLCTANSNAYLYITE